MVKKLVKGIYRVFHKDGRFLASLLCGLYIAIFFITLSLIIDVIFDTKITDHISKFLLLVIMLVFGLIIYFGPAAKFEAEILESGKSDVSMNDSAKVKMIFAGMVLFTMFLALINKGII